MISVQSANEFQLSAGSFTATVAATGAALISFATDEPDGERLELVRAGDSPAGATCGRFANRIGGSAFELDGESRRLEPNEGANHLHGGPDGFDRRIWEVLDADSQHVSFHLVSPHLDQGYPGELKTTVTYRTQPGELEVGFVATTDRPTVINLTNHTYWNLGGLAGTLSDHDLTVRASERVEVDSELIPTGRIVGIAGDYDLSRPRALTQSLDDCFVLTHSPDQPVATLTHRPSGRTLDVFTDQPGLQVYTADHAERFGVALEAQGFPDAPNQTGFPSARLDPGETYRRFVRFSLGTR